MKTWQIIAAIVVGSFAACAACGVTAMFVGIVSYAAGQESVNASSPGYSGHPQDTPRPAASVRPTRTLAPPSANYKPQQPDEPVNQPAQPARQTGGLSFAEIRDNMNQMTDLQFDDYRKGLIGEKVSWQGWVDEVKSENDSQGRVLIDMDAPDELSVFDLEILIPLELAKSLQKDQKITFTGTIQDIQNVLGICSLELDNVTVK